MPKKNTLTEGERIAVDVYAKTGNKSQAIREGYPDSTNPDTMGTQVFARPRVKQAVQEALDKLGITTSTIIKRFDQQASKGKNEAAKVRANENLAQLADLYPDKNNSPDGDNNGITINLQY